MADFLASLTATANTSLSMVMLLFPRSLLSCKIIFFYRKVACMNCTFKIRTKMNLMFTVLNLLK